MQAADIAGVAAEAARAAAEMQRNQFLMQRDRAIMQRDTSWRTAQQVRQKNRREIEKEMEANETPPALQRLFKECDRRQELMCEKLLRKQLMTQDLGYVWPPLKQCLIPAQHLHPLIEPADGCAYFRDNTFHCFYRRRAKTYSG